MVTTYDKLKKQLKENMNYKSKDELYSLTESLFTEFFKAYAEDDLDRMKEIDATINDFKMNLKTKYDNVDAVVTGVELQKLKELEVLKDYQHNLVHIRNKILIYQIIIHELLSKLNYLKKLLCFYFTHAVKDGGNVSDLDSIVADVRDDIVDLSGVAEIYYNDPTPEDVNMKIETSKEIIHDVFNYDYMKFLKENGMVEIQMEMIELNKLNHQYNKEYKQLKLEIDDLFSENNGFKKISESFIRMIKTETDVGASVDAIMDYLPEYDIATATFIPTEPPVDAEN